MQGKRGRTTIGGYPVSQPDIVPVEGLHLVGFEKDSSTKFSGISVGILVGASGHVPWCGEGATEQTRYPTTRLADSTDDIATTRLYSGFPVHMHA
jgi:hypothetical protein